MWPTFRIIPRQRARQDWPPENKIAGESAFDKIDIVKRILLAHDFTKTLDLALGLEINNDLCFVRAPFAQARGKLCAFCFQEHEITNCEFANFGILKRATEILWTDFNPGFADLNASAGIFVRLDVDLKMIAGQIIPDDVASIIHRSEQNISGI